jgi:hypothetical protein
MHARPLKLISLTCTVPLLQHHSIPHNPDDDQTLDPPAIQAHLHVQSLQTANLHHHGPLRGLRHHRCLNGHLHMHPSERLLEHGHEALCQMR